MKCNTEGENYDLCDVVRLLAVWCRCCFSVVLWRRVFVGGQSKLGNTCVFLRGVNRSVSKILCDAINFVKLRQEDNSCHRNSVITNIIE